MSDQALEQSQQELSVEDRLANFMNTEQEEQENEEPTAEQDNSEESEQSEEVDTPEEEQVETEEEAETEANLVEIEVDGELYAVPEQLKEKIMLHADYTRKTQEVAEQRKQIETAQAQLQAQAQMQQQSLTEYAQLIALDNQLQSYGNVDWNQLYENDPAEFVRVKEARRDLADARQNLANQIQLKQQQQYEQQSQIRLQAIEEGNKVLARDIPQWNEELAKSLNTFAVDKFGFTPEEVAQVIDPRVVKLLHKAYLYDKSQSNKPLTEKRVQNLPKVAKPSGKTGKTQSEANQDQLKARLKKSGSIDDALALYLARKK